MKGTGTGTESVNLAVNFVMKTLPDHLTELNRNELETIVRAMIGLGRHVLERGTGDKEMATLFRAVGNKFCAQYPPHLFGATHESLRTAIQSPTEIVHYSPAHMFGMSKRQLKNYPERYARYMRTREIQCRGCFRTKPGTEFSDKRLIGRRKRRVCNACVATCVANT